MKTKLFILIWLQVSVALVQAQGFINLAFENVVITASSPSGYGFNTGTAKVQGWTAYNGWSSSNYSGGTSLTYNNEPLDAPGVSLEGTNYFRPAIGGKYSIFLQGGSQYSPTTNGASIGQTGQISNTIQSLTYWGGPLTVTFNGNLLAFNIIGGGADYSVWQANVSSFAGQTGELLFTAPWQNNTFLDNIQFSTVAVPEPGVWSLLGLSALLVGGWRGRQARLSKLGVRGGKC